MQDSVDATHIWPNQLSVVGYHAETGLQHDTHVDTDGSCGTLASINLNRMRKDIKQSLPSMKVRSSIYKRRSPLTTT
jgi:hypothetical protein